MDSSILNQSQISSLLREFITDEELAEYEAQNEQGAVWERSEEFMVGLSKIPNAKLKLAIWKFTYEYTENWESIASTVKNTRGACKEISENVFINKILSYVLTIGNILNGGTPKGQADGFSLDILTKLNSIKDVNNKTLMQYVCSMVFKDDEVKESIKKKFPCLGESAKISMNETQSSLNKLKKEIKEQNENVQKLTNNDAFTIKAASLIDRYTTEVADLEKEFTENLKSIQDTILFYGYTTTDSKYKSPEEFFTLMNDFLNEVDKSLPKTEPKKVFNRKYEVGKKIIENANVMDDLLKQLKSRSNV